jgi:hypothetical protein
MFKDLNISVYQVLEDIKTFDALLQGDQKKFFSKRSGMRRKLTIYPCLPDVKDILGFPVLIFVFQAFEDTNY